MESIEIFRNEDFDYFDLIPFELLEIILSFLGSRGIRSFISFKNIRHQLNWNRIHFLRFGQRRTNEDLDYDKYSKYLVTIESF